MEVRCPDPDCRTKYFVYHSESQNGQQGVAIAIKAQWSESVSSWAAINTRLMYVELASSPIPLTIVSAYAPTNDSEQSSKDAFYDALDELLTQIPKRNALVLGGDFNAKIAASFNATTGRHSLSNQQTDNGLRLQSFAETHNLLITNTFFQQRNTNRLATWKSPDGHYRNQIDFILIRRRWKSSVISARAYWGPVGRLISDHAAVVTSMRLRLKRFKAKPKYRMIAVERFKMPDICNRFAALLTSSEKNSSQPSTLDEKWKTFRDTVVHAAKTTCG